MRYAHHLTCYNSMGMHMWHCLFHMLSGPGKNIEFMRRTKVLIPLPPLSVTIELKKKKKILLRFKYLLVHNTVFMVYLSIFFLLKNVICVFYSTVR